MLRVACACVLVGEGEPVFQGGLLVSAGLLLLLRRVIRVGLVGHDLIITRSLRGSSSCLSLSFQSRRLLVLSFSSLSLSFSFLSFPPVPMMLSSVCHWLGSIS